MMNTNNVSSMYLMKSEIARLIYGYLIDEGCNDASKVLLETYPYLNEFAEGIRLGHRYSYKINHKSLVDYLNQAFISCPNCCNNGLEEEKKRTQTVTSNTVDNLVETLQQTISTVLLDILEKNLCVKIDSLETKCHSMFAPLEQIFKDLTEQLKSSLLDTISVELNKLLHKSDSLHNGIQTVTSLIRNSNIQQNATSSTTNLPTHLRTPSARHVYFSPTVKTPGSNIYSPRRKNFTPRKLSTPHRLEGKSSTTTTTIDNKSHHSQSSSTSSSEPKDLSQMLGQLIDDKLSGSGIVMSKDIFKKLLNTINSHLDSLNSDNSNKPNDETKTTTQQSQQSSSSSMVENQACFESSINNSERLTVIKPDCDDFIEKIVESLENENVLDSLVSLQFANLPSNSPLQTLSDAVLNTPSFYCQSCDQFPSDCRCPPNLTTDNGNNHDHLNVVKNLNFHNTPDKIGQHQQQQQHGSSGNYLQMLSSSPTTTSANNIGGGVGGFGVPATSINWTSPVENATSTTTTTSTTDTSPESIVNDSNCTLVNISHNGSHDSGFLTNQTNDSILDASVVVQVPSSTKNVTTTANTTVESVRFSSTNLKPVFHNSHLQNKVAVSQRKAFSRWKHSQQVVHVLRDNDDVDEQQNAPSTSLVQQQRSSSPAPLPPPQAATKQAPTLTTTIEYVGEDSPQNQETVKRDKNAKTTNNNDQQQIVAINSSSSNQSTAIVPVLPIMSQANNVNTTNVNTVASIIPGTQLIIPSHPAYMWNTQQQYIILDSEGNSLMIVNGNNGTQTNGQTIDTMVTTATTTAAAGTINSVELQPNHHHQLINKNDNNEQNHNNIVSDNGNNSDNKARHNTINGNNQQQRKESRKSEIIRQVSLEAEPVGRKGGGGSKSSQSSLNKRKLDELNKTNNNNNSKQNCSSKSKRRDSTIPKSVFVNTNFDVFLQSVHPEHEHHERNNKTTKLKENEKEKTKH